MRLTAGVFATLAAFGIAFHAHAAPAYTLTEIPLANAYAYAINDQGDVVGSRWPDRSSFYTNHAFLFRKGKVILLTIPGAASSSARAINNRGLIAGSFGLKNSTEDHGFCWHAGRVETFASFGVVTGMDAAGDAVGYREGGQGNRPYIYSKGRETPLGNRFGQALAVNAAGTIVGWDWRQNPDTSSRERAVVFHGSHPSQRLPVPPNGNPFYDSSVATNINRRGDIVGYGLRVQGKFPHYTSSRYVFRYHGGSLSVLGGFSGVRIPQNVVINDRGLIAAFEYHEGNVPPRSVLFLNNRRVPLEDLVRGSVDVNLQGVRAINNRGQILVNGQDAAGVPKSFVLNPVATVDVNTRNQTTKKSHFAVKGRTTGNVTHIAYRVGSTGRWRTVDGGTNWNLPVRLKPGINVINVVARTTDGDSPPDQVTVVRR